MEEAGRVSSGHTRILVTGGSGRLGAELRAYFPMAEYPSHQQLDVRHMNSVTRWFGMHTVDLVIHLAAATRHDTPMADLVQDNIVGTANVVLAARKQGARVVYTSTDYVYPGTAGGYRETDPVLPWNGYAWSKLGGETAVQMYPNSLIVRGSWYSTLDYTVAATDAFTSKLPVHKAAFYVAALSCSTLTGVVNVGGERRSIFEVALEFSPTVTPLSRKNLKWPVPPDVTVDTTKLRRLM